MMTSSHASFQYVTDDFTGYNVLVTGASGVQGSGVATAQALRRTPGVQVTVLQRSASGLDGVHEIRGSVTDPETAHHAVQGMDTVVHIAAKVSVSRSAKEYEQVNIEGTRTLLTAAQTTGVSRWIHISSPSSGPFWCLDHWCRSRTCESGHCPSAITAATKAAGELLALAADSEQFRVLVLRPHSLMWGPGDTQLTERIIDRARQNRLPLLDGGTALVDTLFLLNAVEAIVTAINPPSIPPTVRHSS